MGVGKFSQFVWEEETFDLQDLRWRMCWLQLACHPPWPLVKKFSVFQRNAASYTVNIFFKQKKILELFLNYMVHFIGVITITWYFSHMNTWFFTSLGSSSPRPWRTHSGCPPERRTINDETFIPKEKLGEVQLKHHGLYDMFTWHSFFGL